MATYQVVDIATGEVVNRIVADAVFVATLEANADGVKYVLEVSEKDVMDEIDSKVAEVDAIAINPILWSALTAEQQQAWADYRQALLDIPQQAGFPNEVVWPTKPTEGN